MNYKVLGSIPVEIELGDGFIVADSNAERYTGCIGKRILEITSTMILEFKNTTREVFRLTSLTPTDGDISDAPPQRYRVLTWIETECVDCGKILKYEKSGFKEGFEYHCKKCRKGGGGRIKPHPISDDEMLELYFKKMMSCVDIADFVGSKTGFRPSPSTIGRWLRAAIKTDSKNRLLRTQGESSVLARYQSAIKAGKIIS